jgi:uncharacterized protein YheU (UPF0270 family)
VTKKNKRERKKEITKCPLEQLHQQHISRGGTDQGKEKSFRRKINLLFSCVRRKVVYMHTHFIRPNTFSLTLARAGQQCECVYQEKKKQKVRWRNKILKKVISQSLILAFVSGSFLSSLLRVSVSLFLLSVAACLREKSILQLRMMIKM